MKRIRWIALLCLPLAAQEAVPPRHIVSTAEPLTEPSTLAPRDVAEKYLRTLIPRYGWSESDLAGVYVAREYRTRHNGVTHLVFQQRFQDVQVANAEWTVNVDSDGRVINAGGMLAHAPGAGVTAPDSATALAAVRVAASEVNPRLGERYLPFQASAAKGLKFSRGGFAEEIDAEAVWFAVNGVLRPAWKFELVDEDGIHEYSVIVDTSGRLLANQSRTFSQSPPRGLVFDRNSPQPNPKPGVPLLTPPALVNRTMQSFAGDPRFSPKGWVSGTETAGNNAVAGANPTGFECISALTCFARPITAVSATRDFSFPLELGEGAPLATSFTDAATVNLFYWVNRAHDLYYELGFDEAAGNFQQDNFNRGGVGGDPMLGYSQFGIAGVQGPRIDEDNYFAFRKDDGSQARIAITFDSTFDGRLFDADFDAETILHEYTHGVSNRLVRQLGSSFHGRAMGEGWSDFFALEFLTPEGAPPDGVYPFSEYPNQFFGAGIRSRPYTTSLEINPLTFANLGHVDAGPEVHADGEIWMEALWEMRANLMKQHGEREGRRRARLLVLDGMKLSPPAPSMLEMRDAILLADRADFKSASQNEIWAAFARRGMGALAQAASGNSVHVSASFEPPSPAGSLRFAEDQYVIGEDLHIVLQDANLDAQSVRIQLTGSSGDLEDLLLRRSGLVFVGTIHTWYAPVGRGDGLLELIPGDIVSAYYVDANPARLIQTTAPAGADYSFSVRTLPYQFSGERPMGLRRVQSKIQALPFEFPYFGKTYSAVYVYQNGLLTFDLPNYLACTDAGSLAALNAIAPMWMDLRTSGAAQSSEDVYMSSTPDSVTFRWVAETVADFLGSAPQPVNFAATLFRDGRIQFQYGSGNRNLSSGSQLLGCPAGTATVGISNGHETYRQIVTTHDSKGTLENASTVVFDPPYNFSTLPVGRLESPAPGDHVQGVLSGKGIIYDEDPEGGVRRLDLLIDGIAEDRLDGRVARADFCGQQAVRGCPNVGFTFSEPLDLLGIKPGRHTLQLRATNWRGGFTDFPETPVIFEVDPGPAPGPVGAVESPADGEEISGRMAVRGYALATNVRIIGAELLIDGINLGPISYGDVRNDICGTYPAPRPVNCPRVGFSVVLDTANIGLALSNGEHTVAVRVQDESGRLTTLGTPVTFVLKNTVGEPPTAVLSLPQTNQRVSGTMQVSGHAFTRVGAVTHVLLYIDNISYGEIPYGRPRPEACAQLPDVKACPNIGFDLDFNTRLLNNGPHTLFIQVVDDKGGFALAPPTGFFGLSFVVAN